MGTFIPYQEADDGTGRVAYAGNKAPEVPQVERFTELWPTRDGAAKTAYHVNHFIGVVQENSKNPLTDDSVNKLAGKLLDNFPMVFSKGNVARARVGEKSGRALKHNDLSTIEFVLNKQPKVLPVPHTDWVSMSRAFQAFYGTTLKREFYTVKEEEYLKNVAYANQVGGNPFMFADQEVIDVGRSHFLSGRRSWKISRYEGRLCIETATVERYTNWSFLGASYLLSDRKEIRGIWTQLVINAAESFGLELEDDPRNLQPIDAYQLKGNIAFVEDEFDNVNNLMASSWWKEMGMRFPGLPGIVLK